MCRLCFPSQWAFTSIMPFFFFCSPSFLGSVSVFMFENETRRKAVSSVQFLLHNRSCKKKIRASAASSKQTNRFYVYTFASAHFIWKEEDESFDPRVQFGVTNLASKDFFNTSMISFHSFFLSSIFFFSYVRTSLVFKKIRTLERKRKTEQTERQTDRQTDRTKRKMEETRGEDRRAEGNGSQVETFL